MEESCLPNLFYALLVFQVVAGAIIMTSLVAQYMADKVLKDHERRIRLLEHSDGNFSKPLLLMLLNLTFHILKNAFRKVLLFFFILILILFADPATSRNKSRRCAAGCNCYSCVMEDYEERPSIVHIV